MAEPLAKICGMTRREDVTLAKDLGADFLGFIFHPSSPRSVDVAVARELAVPGPRRVGVFVKQDVAEVNAVLQQAGLDLAQLHGDQDESFCRAVGPERVIKVLWPQRYGSLAELTADLERFAPVCSLFLLDSGVSGGGHGASLDFTFLSGLSSPRPWLLAGGIGPDNLEEALAACRPDGLDLNSGVESSPGIKDHHKVREAFARLRKDTKD